MKFLSSCLIVAGLTLAPLACRAQEGAKPAAGEHASEAGGEEGEGSLKIWEWANFLVLAGGLGYLAVKNLGPAFAERSLKIRQEISSSEEIRKQAEARAAEVDRKMAHLQDDIAALRADSQKEAEAEMARYSQHTAAEIAKTQAHAEQEIVSAGKAARMELKQYAAQLAVALAEQKIRTRINPDTEDALVRGFVRNLDRVPSRPHTT